MAENKKIYELVGKITSKEKDKARNGTKYAGKDYWRLQTIIEHDEEAKEILAYEDYLENKQIWSDIINRKYYGKKYIFLCHKYFRSYWLVDWQELKETSKKNKENGSN